MFHAHCTKPADPPPGFHGQLRPYQREGLGWLLFLERFGFGGCLADDMGLGKTVQVLALLHTRCRRRADRTGPSLVVAPRSLIFNWRREAERFTPNLNVLDNTGPRRQKDPEDLAEKLLLALDDPSPSPIVEAALATAEGHDWPRVALNYVEHLRRLPAGG